MSGIWQDDVAIRYRADHCVNKRRFQRFNMLSALNRLIGANLLNLMMK